MMSWGPKRDAPNEIRNQTERKVGVDITIAIRNLGDLDRVPSPQYNKPETKDHFKKIPNHKRTNDQSPGTPRETDNPSNSEKKTARKCLIAAWGGPWDRSRSASQRGPRASPTRDPEAGVLPGVWRNSIPEYFPPTVCPLFLDFVIELGK
ncbi:hypothetical protein DY000_02006915 [Brassica cretica]|uniref:Uncharacterized protein n=1 Tax=Brassica cretica TaxID=69181 RepID=A0ABQ7CM29_BRACR|nr:hypothetical protein DY000_02006915 [Brassica cretica]